MGSFAAVVLSVLISGAHFTTGAWLKRSDNATFFNGPFNPCKGSRPRHPVELVKTHVFATKIFNEVGIKTIIRLALKYHVPQEFLYKIGDIACIYALFEYTALSGGGNLILPLEVKAVHAVAFLKRFVVAAKIARPEFVIRYRGHAFTLPWSAVSECIDLFVPVALRVGKGDIPRDVNMVLHAIEHARRMIL